MLRQFNFEYKGLNAVVYDLRDISKPYIQVNIIDPAAPDRVRSISVPAPLDDADIPTNIDLVNYALSQDQIQGMFDRLVQDGFPISYDEGQV